MGVLRISLVLAIVCLPAWGAVVEMRSGQRIEGDLRPDGGKLLVKPQTGQPVRIELADVRHLQAGTAVKTPEPKKQEKPPTTPAENPDIVQGLRAEYFEGREFKELKLVRVEPRIDIWWSEDATPDPVVPKDFGVRWTGQIEPAYSDTYWFQIECNDAGRLWIDNNLLIDRWNGPGLGGANIELKKGQRYNIRMEYHKGRWGGTAKLMWSSRSQSHESVQPKALFPPPGTNPPRVKIKVPADAAPLVAAPIAILEADASDPDGQVKRVEFTADGEPIGVAERAPWSIQWTAPPLGYHKVVAKAIDDAGITATSEAVYLAVAGNGGGTLPAPWIEMPVGKIEPLGSTQQRDGRFVLSATSGDLWGDQEIFNFVFRTLEGDFAFTARIAELKAPQAMGTAVGLLIREHLRSERSKQAFLGVASDSGISFMRRDNTWEEQKRIEEKLQVPCWLRLTRREHTITASWSADGSKWQLLGQRRIEMTPTVYIGLAIANASSEGSRATLDQVSVSNGSAPMESTVKGVMLRSGSIIEGDIWSVDDTRVRMGCFDREVTIPTVQVARLLIKPLSGEVLGRVEPGRTGAILTSGDFCDGTVSFKDGQLQVASVLFGVRRFNTWDQTIAAILRDVEMAPCAYELRTSKGSVLRAGAVTIDGDRLKVVESSGPTISVPLGQVQEIRAN